MAFLGKEVLVGGGTGTTMKPETELKLAGLISARLIGFMMSAVALAKGSSELTPRSMSALEAPLLVTWLLGEGKER